MDQLVRSVRQAGPFAFCGIAVRRGGQDAFYLDGMDGLAAGPDTFWRAASISKILTGRAAWRVCRDAGVDVATPAYEVLGPALRGPKGQAPTIADLACHASGITDAGGYIIPPDQPLSDWLDQTGDAIWSGAAVGQQMEYANLNYVLLARVVEVVSDMRFDQAVAKSVTTSLNLQAYFNWAGAPVRPDHIATYRLGDAGFEAQIDKGAVTAPDVPVGHPHAFAPQGGARITLTSALEIASTLATHPQDHGWRDGQGAVLGPDGLFQSYAWGLQIYDDPAFYPHPLRGHFAKAYGMCGGVWSDPTRDVQFAYVLNGLPMNDENDALRPEELAIFKTIGDLSN
ncbi:serine hydrolase domain-containing protein [Pseudooctadecabacter jejudonensis]|uniref:Beta-lactamase/D-alanine carboxypeptidase n=1 Tax=Pseudooctadecabacter jejudonensis TaxID=1391910 RepID=A0A1Y5S1S3_9RHOB|nr:serine hydrolase domain-containing protein [Pseudooctadecabacter jejudonensis]SLN30356.1 beta-lactamase/D-alanine carboxypeptidase [Pseudooctadecabacter jejudonensis]